MTRRCLLLLCALAALLFAVAPAASGDLSGKIGQSRARDHQLQSAIGADRVAAARYTARIADLTDRLNGLQRSLYIQRAQLATVQGELRAARARLLRLKLGFAHDRQVLSDQLRAQYEAPHPDLITVVMNARGFADLLELSDAMRTIQRGNAAITRRVGTARTAVAAQTTRLTALESRQQRVTSSVLVERDQVASIHLELVNRQLVFLRAKSRKSAQLASLRQTRSGLERELAKVQARAAAASGGPGISAPPGVGLPSGGAPAFGSHGGQFGFFPAPGTNYTVGAEPAIAARLDELGKALSLHLIGISGYRSPAHSVEVGGFANDPHTRGEASDTPGVEGVSEATLNRFGLTRPFPGAAEADHVQLA